MTLRLVTANSNDLPKIKELYLKAFPAVERVPFWLLKKRTKAENAEFCSLYEDDKWLGFIYTLKNQELVYVFFLAIDPANRSKGYGSGLMELVKERYAGQVIGLSAEKEDEQAPNNEERKRRLKFYAKNGFFPTDFYTAEKGGVDFEFLTYQKKSPRPQAYPELMRQVLGIWQKFILPIKVVEK
ncbi:MAG: GNAT family N-acetyltransferase [Lactobacillus sp.]|nr:GNAT family N-acetyltransferase [Lactobacillus sp.]